MWPGRRRNARSLLPLGPLVANHLAPEPELQAESRAALPCLSEPERCTTRYTPAHKQPTGAAPAGVAGHGQCAHPDAGERYSAGLVHVASRSRCRRVSATVRPCRLCCIPRTRRYNPGAAKSQVSPRRFLDAGARGQRLVDRRENSATPEAGLALGSRVMPAALPLPGPHMARTAE